MRTLASRSIAARIAALAVAVLLFWTFLPASGNESGIQTIVITMRHSRFIPAHITVRRGTTVRFVITNADPIDHELILGNEAVQRRHETGTEPEHGAVPGEVTVHAETTAETTYTFSRPGLLLIGCHAPGHYAYGMKGWVWVAP
jgi:uncharacterized cupredoxin-like copper-binding protein